MKQNSALVLIILISYIFHFLLTLYLPVAIYPSIPEFMLWYLILFYPEKIVLIIIQIFLLETFSSPPVPGFYLLMTLFVAGGVSLAKLFFYVDSLLFVFIYLLSVEVLRWLLWGYILLIEGGTDGYGITYHLIFAALNLFAGTGAFLLFDQILRRKMYVELVK